MLTFYYHPISINARRVWVTLLEKQIPFQPILVSFESEGLGEQFTEVNPLQRIPVIIDNGFRVIESLAILDYLEARYPTPALMPSDPQEIAIARMVEMVAVNELQPITLTLMQPVLGVESDSMKQNAAQERMVALLQFYENLLGSNLYFIGDKISLADIVAGTLIPSLSFTGVSLEPYPHLAAWAARLLARESWQQTLPTQETIEAALPSIKKILERRARAV